MFGPYDTRYWGLDWRTVPTEGLNDTPAIGGWDTENSGGSDDDIAPGIEDLVGVGGVDAAVHFEALVGGEFLGDEPCLFKDIGDELLA